MNNTTSYEQAVADLAAQAQHMKDHMFVVMYSWAIALMSIYKVTEIKALTDLTKAIERAGQFTN
jgi:hypothetical protein